MGCTSATKVINGSIKEYNIVEKHLSFKKLIRYVAWQYYKEMIAPSEYPNGSPLQSRKFLSSTWGMKQISRSALTTFETGRGGGGSANFPSSWRGLMLDQDHSNVYKLPQIPIHAAELPLCTIQPIFLNRLLRITTAAAGRRSNARITNDYITLIN
jgi:hypothetical protein